MVYCRNELETNVKAKKKLIRHQGEAMSEWQDMQQKPNTKLRDLLKNKKAKTRKLTELSKTEQNRLAKLNAMLDELRRGENVQNRRLATWLTEAEYEGFKSDWESQQQIREELNDKPDELKRYEDKLKKEYDFKENKDNLKMQMTRKFKTTLKLN